MFIAIKIPETIKEKIRELQKELRETITGVRWVKPEIIHLTLKFLGEVEERQLEDVCSVIKASIKEIPKFNISLAELGAFPNLRRPRVLWISLKVGREKIIELITKLEQGFAKIGFKPEDRKPSPHLTIGRVKKRGSGIELQEFETEAFTAVKVYLIKSTLTPQGPIYEDIKEFELYGEE